MDIHTTEVADDWSERWRSFHRPVLVAPPPPTPGRPEMPAIRVRPPWEPSEASGPELQEVVIDPGQAFGTGAHATTRLCLQLLLELSAEDQPAGPLLDVGCGSGVLAIVASKLGYAPVVAFDNDPLSVQATRENATANGVELDVLQADLRAGRLPRTAVSAPAAGERAPVVVSNLLRGLLLELAGALARGPAGADRLRAPGRRVRGGGPGVRDPSGDARAEPGGERRVGGPVARGTGRSTGRARRRRVPGRKLARQRGRGEHVGAVDEVDRRAHAVLAAEQLVGRRQRRSDRLQLLADVGGFGVTAGGDAPCRASPAPAHGRR